MTNPNRINPATPETTLQGAPPPPRPNHETWNTAATLRLASAAAGNEGAEAISAKHLLIALVHTGLIPQCGSLMRCLLGWEFRELAAMPGWIREGAAQLGQDAQGTQGVQLPLDPAFPPRLRRKILGRRDRPGSLGRWVPALLSWRDPYVDQVLQCSKLTLEGPLAALDRAARTAQAVLGDLRRAVIGQSEAVEALAHMAFRLTMGCRGSGPRGVALFFGPPGVGKTLAATRFAESLARRGVLGAERAKTIVIDLTQFTQYSQGNDLFGQGASTGPLAGHISKFPESVLIFNELEKAHRTVIQNFLPVLDTGKQNCAGGKIIDYTGSVFVFTSNLGAELWDREGGSQGGLSLDPIDLLAISGRLDRDREGWDQAAILSKEFLSRIPPAGVVMFTEPKGHHLFTKICDRLGAPPVKAVEGRIP